MSKKSLHGFTLLELSIVLLIIGMITTGIIGGVELLRQSKLQSVVSEVEKYQTAINTFELAYNALPGDMKNASEFWPGQTIDGNGDGKVKEHWPMFEYQLAFQHLALAEIIPGSYAADGAAEVPWVTVPGSDIDNLADYRFQYMGPNEDIWEQAYDRRAGNAFRLADHRGGSGSPYEVITPYEAWGIDVKMDDGMPQSGDVYGGEGIEQEVCNTPNVNNWWNAINPPEKYNVADKTNKDCILVFFSK